MEVGTLHFNGSRWSIWYPDGRDFELHCGNVLALKIGGNWVQTSIEHGGGRYYSTTPGTCLCSGVEARRG